jgi:hypothetical protein
MEDPFMKKKFILAIFMVSIFSLSCSNDDDVKINKNYNVDDFFNKAKENSVQTFNLNTSELPKTINLAGGSKITIEPGTFAKGGVAITGAFTVEVREFLNPSDIVFGGTNTNLAYGEILKSQGFIHLDVKQNGTSVDKNFLKNIDVELKQPQNVDGEWTMLWEGIENSGDDGDQFAWDNLSADALVIDQTGGGMMEIMGKGDYFPFKLGKLGWFNCDVYWDYVNKTTVRVTIEGNPVQLANFEGETGYTCVFFHGNGDLVVAQLYTLEGNNVVKSYDDSMPIGKKGTLIAFTVKEGRFYLAKRENLEITQDLAVTLTLTETTEAGIQAAINALNNNY